MTDTYDSPVPHGPGVDAPDPANSVDSIDVAFASELAAAADHETGCLVALAWVESCFGPTIASVGVANFGSGQLMVLTNAGLEPSHPPTSVSFPLGAPTLLADVLGSPEVHILAPDTFTERYPVVASVMRRPDMHSMVAVGFHRGTVAGSISMAVAHPFSVDDERRLRDLAQMIGAAFSRISAAEVERRSTTDFQRALLPGDRLGDTVRLERSSRYLPGRNDAAIGGDWLDLFHFDDRRVAFVVGDIVGKGISAALHMSQASAALRALLVATGSPEAALEQFDRVAAVSPGVAGSSAVVGLIDGASGRVQLSCAGHPPPVHVAFGRAALVEGGRGPLVGYGGPGGRTSVELLLEPGDTLVCYTDGLVERRDVAIDQRLERLREVVEMHHEEPAEMLAESILAGCSMAGHRDDVALVCLRRTDPTSRTFGHTMVAEAPRLVHMRRAFRQWLVGQRLAVDVDAVIIATSEAAANAVEHAYRGIEPGRIVIEAVIDRYDCLSVMVLDEGRWGTQLHDAVRGRGLSVLRAIADEVDVRPSDRGTIVRFDAQPASGR